MTKLYCIVFNVVCYARIFAKPLAIFMRDTYRHKGYRDAIYRGPFRKHFKGPYYSYGLTFYPGRIYKDLRSYLNGKYND